MSMLPEETELLNPLYYVALAEIARIRVEADGGVRIHLLGGQQGEGRWPDGSEGIPGQDGGRLLAT